jgi:Superinfection immunity protein
MSAAAGFAEILAFIAGYFAPTITVLARKVPNRGSVIVVDLLLGWTVIGWVVAVAMACRSKPPAVQAGPPEVYGQYGRHHPGH